MNENRISLGILGVFIFAGLLGLGYFISQGIQKAKAGDRTIVVKGLSEREVWANIAIWPLKFTVAGNDLGTIYSQVSENNRVIIDFLKSQGFKDEEINVAPPSIFDREAERFGEKKGARYVATSIVNVYTDRVDLVLKTMKKTSELVKKGIALQGESYDAKPEFLFTELNKIKPEMIEEATKNARKAALKFAKDSNSRLGKIKRARQGLFTITDRDRNTPYIKKVRVVTTVEYYLID